MILCHVWELYFVFSETKQAQGITCEKTRKSLFLIKPNIYFPCNSIVYTGLFFVLDYYLTDLPHVPVYQTRLIRRLLHKQHRDFWTICPIFIFSASIFCTPTSKPKPRQYFPISTSSTKKLFISCIIGSKEGEGWQTGGNCKRFE